jgi:hypothetical protein
MLAAGVTEDRLLAEIESVYDDIHAIPPTQPS